MKSKSRMSGGALLGQFRVRVPKSFANFRSPFQHNKSFLF